MFFFIRRRTYFNHSFCRSSLHIHLAICTPRVLLPECKLQPSRAPATSRVDLEISNTGCIALTELVLLLWGYRFKHWFAKTMFVHMHTPGRLARAKPVPTIRVFTCCLPLNDGDRLAHTRHQPVWSPDCCGTWFKFPAKSLNGFDG